MSHAALLLPELVRRRAMTLGGAGVAWLAGLDGLVRDLVAEWGLATGRVLSGGTEALLLTARTARRPCSRSPRPGSRR